MQFINTILENPLAQILGIVAMIIVVFGLTQKDDKKVLKIIIIANSLWFFHFLILGIFSAAASVFMGIIRIFLSLKYKRNKRIFAGVLASTIVLGIITYDSHLSLLPIIGTCISVYGYFFFEKVRLRIFMVITSFFWLTFDLNVGSVGGTINEILVQSILVITMYKMIHEEGKRVYFVDRIMDIVLHKKDVKEDIGRFVFISDYIKYIKKVLYSEIKFPKIKFFGKKKKF